MSSHAKIEDAATPRPPGLTLVLGGGGFKGMAHLGVLQVLEESGLPVERVVGNSVGALIGGAYCALGGAGRTFTAVNAFLASEGFQGQSLVGFRRREGRVPMMRRLLHGIRRQMALERIFRRNSALGGQALRLIVKSLVPSVEIAELERPLAICALDLVRGEPVVITRGNLCVAVSGSSAVPGFFPPVEWDGSLICDAGIVDNLPVEAARSLGRGPVVAVDLSDGLGRLRPDATGMELLLRAQEISTRLANQRRGQGADLVLRPALGDRHWLDTTHLPRVVEAGAACTREALPALTALLEPSARRAV
ncbi:MAG: patatin-like phospholipase family protein [Planctomycetota bacterium]|jgi:NTE family protein